MDDIICKMADSSISVKKREVMEVASESDSNSSSSSESESESTASKYHAQQEKGAVKQKKNKQE